MNEKRSARTGRNTRWKASYFYIVAGIKICYNTDVCKANRKERMGIVMIKAEKLSYSFPQKDLYNNISFTLEDDVHCAFIGTNGTGKSTLVDMILQPDNYLYEGKLTVEVPGRIGYVSQFYSVEDKPEMTVFDYLSDEFVRLQGEINRSCDEMATAEDFEEVMEHYQKAMDEFQAIDGDFYESNIRKQLKLANLQDYENHLLTNLSGGEFKLVQVIREMMEYEVGNGTGGGKNAYVSGYRIGGKSGTSEQLNMHRRADGDYKKVASFVAVLPANDPEILVYVMLDDPNNARTDYSSILAAPVAGNIISEVAPYLGIATDGEDRSGTIVTVPNLVGTEWSNAQVSLNIQGLKHQLQESQSSQSAAPVTYQYPHAGSKVPYGTTIYLYTDTYEGSHTEVPDVTGKSPDFARQMLSAAGLNCVVEGSGTVQAQSDEPGSSVQRGTIITLTCG